MSRPAQVAWGTIISALVAAGAVSLFIARSTAQAEVSPVRERVVKLEADEANIAAALKDLKAAQEKATTLNYRICRAHPGVNCEVQ